MGRSERSENKSGSIVLDLLKFWKKILRAAGQKRVRGIYSRKKKSKHHLGAKHTVREVAAYCTDPAKFLTIKTTTTTTKTAEIKRNSSFTTADLLLGKKSAGSE